MAQVALPAMLDHEQLKHSGMRLMKKDAGHAALDTSMLQSVLQHTMNGVAYCRMVYESNAPADFVYLYTNPAFHRQTGLGEAVGRLVSELIPDFSQRDPGLLERYSRVARGGGPSDSRPMSRRCSNGSLSKCSVRSAITLSPSLTSSPSASG